MVAGPDISFEMVFLGGLQRSGTTLLGRLLSQHSEVSGLVGTPTAEDEGQFIQDVYPNDHELGRKTSRNLRGTSMRWAYNPKAHLTEADAAMIPDARARLDESWRAYWADESAPMRLEKTPSNLTRTRFLQAIYPESRFLIITRHPIIQALAVRKWATVPKKVGLDLSKVVDHWLHAMDTFRKDQPHLRSVEVVSYESLMAQPAVVMVRLQEFLGIQRELLDTSSVRNTSTAYDRYWDYYRSHGRADYVRLNGDRPRDRVYESLERIIAPIASRAEMRRLSKLEPRLNEYGYSLDDLHCCGLRVDA